MAFHSSCTNVGCSDCLIFISGMMSWADGMLNLKFSGTPSPV